MSEQNAVHLASPDTYIKYAIQTFVPHPVSALQQLQFWLDPFHIHTSYQATSEGMSCVKFLAKFLNLNFWQFFKICDFVLFWLGIWCESLVWVIMGRRGLSQNAGILVVLVNPITGSLFVWKMAYCPYSSRTDHLNNVDKIISFFPLIIIWKKFAHRCFVSRKRSCHDHHMSVLSHAHFTRPVPCIDRFPASIGPIYWGS